MKKASLIEHRALLCSLIQQLGMPCSGGIVRDLRNGWDFSKRAASDLPCLDRLHAQLVVAKHGVPHRVQTNLERRNSAHIAPSLASSAKVGLLSPRRRRWLPALLLPPNHVGMTVA